MNDKIEIRNDEIEIEKDRYLKHCPYNIQRAKAAQEKFCKHNGLPLYAPQDGHCSNCGLNIYSCRSHNQTAPIRRYYYTGITVVNAGKYHIVACPHCKKSFCE